MQVFWKKRLVLLGLLFHRQRDRRRTPSWQPELFAYLPALSTFSCGLCRTTEAGKHPCFVCVSPHPGLYFCCSSSFKGMSSGCSVLAQRWKSSATVWQEPQWQPTASLLVKAISLALQSSLYNQLRHGLSFVLPRCPPPLSLGSVLSLKLLHQNVCLGGVIHALWSCHGSRGLSRAWHQNGARAPHKAAAMCPTRLAWPCPRLGVQKHHRRYLKY